MHIALPISCTIAILISNVTHNHIIHFLLVNMHEEVLWLIHKFQQIES
jgi:hypothetical protein